MHCARKQSRIKLIKEEEVKNVEAFVFITIATLYISQEMHSLLKNTGNIKLEKHCFLNNPQNTETALQQLTVYG